MLFSGLTIDLDFTYILVLTLFFLPLLILNGLVFGPYKKLMEERYERLEGALERAKDRVEQAEDKARAFEEKIRVATTRGLEARNAIRLDAQKAMQARIEAEKKKLDDKLGEALAGIVSARDQGLSEAKTEGARLGRLTAGRLLGREVN